jgi:neutral ceramidase
MLNAGFGSTDITPEHPTPLAGFGKARTVCHEGIHDRISANCVFFRNGNESVAVLSCEVIGLRAELCERIRERLPASLGLAPKRLVVTGTHTHGAPVLQGEYLDFFLDRAAAAVQAAHADLRPAVLKSGIGRHREWMGFNRRHLETGFLPVDREAAFLTIGEKDGSLRGLVFNYSCHPSILGPDNLLVTADWPAHTAAMLREALGKDLRVVFLQGTSGDINSGYNAGVSSLGVKIPTRTRETAKSCGETVARALLEAIPSSTPMPDPAIHFASVLREIERIPPDGLEAAREAVVKREAEVERLTAESAHSPAILMAKVEAAYAHFRVTALEENAARPALRETIRQTAFAIGAAGFLGFPGEFLVESGLQLKAASRFTTTFPLGIANDYLGYFPPANAFAEGGYEVACAKFTGETADSWTRSGSDLLNSLHPTTQP